MGLYPQCRCSGETPALKPSVSAVTGNDGRKLVSSELICKLKRLKEDSVHGDKSPQMT